MQTVAERLPEVVWMFLGCREPALEEEKSEELRGEDRGEKDSVELSVQAVLVARRRV